MITQETLSDTQPTQSSQEQLQNCVVVVTPTPPAPVHDDQCCGGTCAVAWKPVRVTAVQS